MVGMSGRHFRTIPPADLIRLPDDAQLFMMPQRQAVGIHRKTGRLTVLEDAWAVAAFLPPTYTQLYLSAYVKQPDAPRLPLKSYAAVGWRQGAYYVAATKIDTAVKHRASSFRGVPLRTRVEDVKKQFPNNRLIAHHADVCALRYGCANAKNFFLGRLEAPIAIAGACNANCLGCISFQPAQSIASPQDRLAFVPTVQEIVEMALAHLRRTADGIVSFGQGCEGEPLLYGHLIADAIREIRRQTASGVLHINTNASRPEMLEKLFDAGLDSVRISLNSVQSELYQRYYRPNHYTLDDVLRSISLACERKKFVSMNYFVFPGMTDSLPEVESLERLLATRPIRLIQWRNFNIDPSWYLEEVCRDYDAPAIGVKTMMKRLRKQFPDLRFGYHNLSAQEMKA